MKRLGSGPRRASALVLSATLAVAGCTKIDSPRGGTVKIQVSGESLGYAGIPFPGDPTIVDGWALSFDHVLVSFGNVRLSDNPDESPSDPSVLGDVVAEVPGPFIADLAVPGDETGADGTSRATLVGVLENQTAKRGAPFQTDVRYGFSYDTVRPVASARRLGVPSSAEPLVDEMIAHGYTVLYVGTARWMGGDGCTSSDPTYFASGFPTEVPFELGFATPTSYLNCQNQNNDGEPLAGESYQRGVAVKANGEALAQITFHLDHPFFGDVRHDPALYFDPFAAAAVRKPAGTVVRIEDLSAIDPTALTDATGAPLPFRTCDGSPLAGSGQRSVETGHLAVDPDASPRQALRGLADFVRYVQSTQGHMNGGEGLCYVRRNYPSPL